jgi:hypothetical protein
MVASYHFFVDTPHEFWVCSEQQNRSGLILRRRKIEDTERDDFLRNRRLTCMQDKEGIALADLELAGLNFSRTPGQRRCDRSVDD